MPVAVSNLTNTEKRKKAAPESLQVRDHIASKVLAPPIYEHLAICLLPNSQRSNHMPVELKVANRELNLPNDQIMQGCSSGFQHDLVKDLHKGPLHFTSNEQQT